MISADDLVALVQHYNPRSDAALIRAAYGFGRQAHEGQTRKSGEPYWTHPVAVAALLAEQQMDDATIVTALLHDTVEDNDAVTLHEIEDRFGEEVAGLVDGVTKLTNIQLDRAGSEQAENFRKLFMATAKDLRVILVKLADRLHNMRTIKAMPEAKQRKKARETMEVFAPLAGRMGMQWMRDELEDLAFRVLDPVQRASIIRRFSTLHGKAGDTIRRITSDIESALEREGIEAEVHGRAKKPYSIWRKMQEKELTFERLSDIYGFRVITSSEADCYRALGAIHRRWRAVPGRFKDYISQPKSNGYRSLHTTVSGRDGKRVEVQIRTQQMHEVANSGVAAHWSYRDGERVENPFAVDPGAWLREMSERLGEQADHEEFLEHVKLEMYADQVFCFTPKGEVVKLPRGATPLDFAYAIHTDLGNSCVGARIDGHQAPFWKELRNGQSVEILRSDGQQPSADWEDMVVTGRAKAAIRRALREIERTERARFGQQLLDRAFTRAGYELDADDLGRAIAVLDLPNVNALFVAVGASELQPEEVFKAANPDRDASAEIAAREEPAVFLRGAQRSPVHRFCDVCMAIPFERIVGVVDSEKGGVLVHRIDCNVLIEEEDESIEWLDMFWGDGADAVARYRARAALTLANEPGALGSVCTGIGALGANIDNLRIVERKPSYYRVVVDLEVRDARHLHTIFRALDNQERVDRVDRISGIDEASA